MTATPDTEIVLSHGDLRLVVAPYGASLRGLSRVLPGGGQELGETMERTARRELMEECGILTGPLLLAGVVDSIHTDALGRVQFHYAIVDYATLWTGQAPVAGSDAEAVAWAELDDLSRYALWSEALRIISLARGLLSL